VKFALPTGNLHPVKLILGKNLSEHVICVKDGDDTLKKYIGRSCIVQVPMENTPTKMINENIVVVITQIVT
jgi:hypothetical protein